MLKSLLLALCGLFVLGSEANAATPEDALNDQTEIEFIDTPLKEGMDFLTDLHNVKIELDPTGLKQAGVQPEKPISFRASGVTLRSALTRMLKPLKLKYVVRGDKIVITDAGKK